MRKLSRFGAAALALALSLTMVAPIGAKAAYNQCAPESFSYRYDNQGTNRGHYQPQNQIKENKDASGKTTVSYTDITTGQTVTEKADLIDYTVPKKLQIPVKEYCYLDVNLGNGDCEIKKLKSSSKKVIKATLDSDYEKYVTTEKVDVEPDKATGQLYYTDAVTKKKVTIANKDAAPNGSHARYTIRLYANKAGKSKVSYDVYNNAGQKTGSVKIQVTAKEVDPFKSVTFAGKSLLWDATKDATNSKYYATEGKFGTYTTKKAGKVSIKMNKGYKLVRVITGTENGYEIKPDPDYKAPDYYESASQIKSQFTSDWGYFESNYTWTDRGAKKSFKLALSKEPNYYIYSKEGKTGKYESTSMYKTEYSTTPIYIYFVDQSTKKLYKYHTSITRRIAK